MTTFARIEDHALTLAPDEIDGVKKPPAEVYIAHGWYPVTYTEQPKSQLRYESDWEQVELDIIQAWYVAENVDESEAYGIIFGGEG